VSSALAVPPEHAAVPKVTRIRLSNSVLLAASGCVLLLGPLTFGAVQPWSIFALEFCAALVLTLWACRQWIHRQVDVVDNVLYFPMAAFFGLALAQWALGTTAYRYATYTQLLLYASYGMLAFVVTQSLRRSSQFDWLAKVVTAYGGIVAAFSILQGIAPNGKLYWVVPVDVSGTVYGPYVNHNHYAGLMEMLTPFPLVLAATHLTDGGRRIFVAAIAALMAGSIFLSGSRGGMLAFLAQAIVLSVLLLRAQKGNWKQPLALGVFLAVVIVFLLWLGGNELTRRLASIHSEAHSELAGGVRLTIDHDCLHMFLKKPFFGWGLGTFPTVYPQFRSFYTAFFVNQAHNDYLQLLTETGVAGFAIAMWFLILVFRHSIAKVKDWQASNNGVLTTAAMLGCIGILVHSFLDFNLQIPANAALFYTLCAIVAAPPLQESQRRRILRRRHLLAEPVVDNSQA
jgi:O-antigen ligase